jgi:hypothetical protein
MRFYNPQFQQPISTFVPDATPWDMILKAGAAKEEAWAKGEAMPGELDLLAAALTPAQGHEDYRADVVKKYKDQVDNILGERTDFGDPTIQRKLKNVITTFGQDPDVQKIKRNKELFDKNIGPQLMDIKNQGALMFVPGYDPLTHQYTGEQHRQDFGVTSISDPNTVGAFDAEASKVKADAEERVRQYGVQIGTDDKGDPIMSKDLESHAVKQVLQKKIDNAMYEYATAISGQDNPYGKWENYWSSKKYGKQLTQEELRDELYNKYHKIGHKYIQKETKDVEKEQPLSPKPGGSGKVKKPEEASKSPYTQITVSSQQLVGADGNKIGGTQAFAQELKNIDEHITKVYDNTTKEMQELAPGYQWKKVIDPQTQNIVLRPFNKDGTEGTLTPQQEARLNDLNSQIVLADNKKSALEKADAYFKESVGLNPDPNVPLSLQINTNEKATYDTALRNVYKERLLTAAEIHSAQGKVMTGSNALNDYYTERVPHLNYSEQFKDLSLNQLEEMYNEVVAAEDPSKGGKTVKTHFTTTVEKDALDILSKKYPSSKLAKYEKKLHSYLTDNYYNTAGMYSVEGITDATTKNSIKSLFEIAIAEGNSNEWSYVDSDNANIEDKDIEELKKKNKELKGTDNVESNFSFYFDEDQNKFVPVVTIGGRKLQYNGTVGEFGRIASEITGYSEYNQDLYTLNTKLQQSGRQSAELPLDPNDKDLGTMKVRTAFEDLYVGKGGYTKIAEGDYMVKVPDDEFTYLIPNNYQLLGFKRGYAEAKKAGPDVLQAFLSEAFKQGIKAVNDPTIDKYYFKKSGGK